MSNQNVDAIYVDGDMNAWAAPDFHFPNARMKYVSAEAYEALQQEVEALAGRNATQEESITHLQSQLRVMKEAIEANKEALRGVAIMLNTELAKYENEPWAQRVRAALAEKES